ncbi:hypothetical protein SSP531S_16000 [Streptomyces spongiicola]|uniref:Uncharacterized protein n=1 Tax=Streptomyces spongiicola TaxID=1690221 RepID=A0A388SUZ6_9ACTN|nr:hypothetical protein SSP531S_16000 [Streptomyces spongiicola]
MALGRAVLGRAVLAWRFGAGGFGGAAEAPGPGVRRRSLRTECPNVPAREREPSGTGLAHPGPGARASWWARGAPASRGYADSSACIAARSRSVETSRRKASDQ